MANAKHIRMIEQEYTQACEKHPKFCDEFTAFDLTTALSGEMSFKLVNSKGPYQADMILQEEVWEATVSHIKGDREHCLQELAQCGAVILRMMQYVEEELWEKGDTCRKEA